MDVSVELAQFCRDRTCTVFHFSEIPLQNPTVGANRTSTSTANIELIGRPLGVSAKGGLDTVTSPLAP